MVLSKIDGVSSFDKANGDQTWHLCSCIKKFIAFNWKATYSNITENKEVNLKIQVLLAMTRSKHGEN